MLAVGALVPGQGRLGKSWKYAEALKYLARYGTTKAGLNFIHHINSKPRKLSEDTSNTQILEEFWEAHRLHDSEDHTPALPVDSPSNYQTHTHSQPSSNGHIRKRNRAASSASALAPSGQSLSPHHPALSLSKFLDALGPLIFPIYKMALLRKRILLVGLAPVELACNYGKVLACTPREVGVLLTRLVYDISLISGIPSNASDLLPLEPLPIRLQPLFSVGIHDMADLAIGGRSAPSPAADEGFGWVACTTDEILSQKTTIYDYVIHIPPSHTDQKRRRVWPKVVDTQGAEIKATQRDLRRYRVFRRELSRTSRSSSTTPPDPSRSMLSVNNEAYDTDTSSALDADLAESQSWSALAYNSFMWWASAGERRSDLEEEAEHDAALLRRLDGEGSPNRPRSSVRSPGLDIGLERGPISLEMMVIAYFHRLTTLILKTLAEIVDDADQNDANLADSQSLGDSDNDVSSATDTALLDPTQDDAQRKPITVEADDMTRMGLDVFSKSDVAFAKELVALYWDREAEVKVGRIECCGVRIC